MSLDDTSSMYELKVPTPKFAQPASRALGMTNGGQIASLTGMRFVAALLVFAHHLDGRFGLAMTGLPLANSAVSFFFVLSGFILTLVYGQRFDRSQRDGGGPTPAKLLSFLKKRFARLWPLHFVCLLICAATVRYVSLEFRPIVANLLLLHSWIPMEPYLFGLNNVSWSISTELFFCFAFPLLVMGGYRGFLWRYGFLILGTLVALILLDSAIDGQWITRWRARLIVQANPLMRMFEFATGILTAYLYANASGRTEKGLVYDTICEIGVLALVIVWWVCVLGFNVLEFVSQIPLVGGGVGPWVWFCSAAPLFGLVVWTFARSSGLISRWMGGRTMVHLGKISFAFYMIHMLVIRFLEGEGDPSVITGTLAITLALVGSLAAAELLYRLIEMPCKEAMVALFEGQAKESVPKYFGEPLKFLLKPLGIVSMVALIVVVGFVAVNDKATYRRSEMERVVQSSAMVHKQVEFQDVSALQGCALKMDDKTIKVELAWKAASEYSPKLRTIYLMDRKMKPLTTDVIAEYQQNRAAKIGDMYEVIEFDRTKFPALHRVMLGWEDKWGKRAKLSKNGQSSALELLELYCADPETAAIDTLVMPPSKLRGLIENNPQGCVRLGNHATLCGYECLPASDGSVTVNLAWRLKPTLTERRVLNFVDAQQEIVGNFGNVSMLQFVRQMEGAEPQFFLDKMLIPAEKLKGAKTITVGLWDEEERKMVTIENGQTLHHGKRLIIGQVE